MPAAGQLTQNPKVSVKLTFPRRAVALIAALAVTASVAVPLTTDSALAAVPAFTATTSNTAQSTADWVDTRFDIPHVGAYFEDSVQAPAGSGPFTSIGGLNTPAGISSSYTTEGVIRFWGTVTSEAPVSFSASVNRADGTTFTIAFSGTILPALPAATATVTTVTTSAASAVVEARISPATATGTVQFRIGSDTALGSPVPVVNGVARYTGALPDYYIGITLYVSAVYSGDASYGSSVSPQTQVFVYRSDTLSGIVTENGIAAAGTTVQLTGTDLVTRYSTTTDSTGRYTFVVPASTTAEASTAYYLRTVLNGTSWYSRQSPQSPTVTASGAYSYSPLNFTGSQDVAITSAPVWTSTTLTPARQGSAYSAQLAASSPGGVTYAYTAGSSGRLPSGLTLLSNGIISGTPTASAGDYGFRVTARSASGEIAEQNLVLTVLPPYNDPAWFEFNLRSAQVGEVYADGVYAMGDPTITYSWSGVTPPGLVLDPTNGHVDGTPTTAGSFTFTITAGNSRASVSRTFTDFVVDQANADVVWIDSSLSGFQYGEQYSDSVSASGYPQVYYGYTGRLPNGINIDYYTGEVYGTPWEEGTFSFTITPSNGSLDPYHVTSVSQSYIMTVAVRPAWTDETLSRSLNVGSPYTDGVKATGTPSVTYSAVGTLPDGVKLDASTGALVGTPTVAKTFSFTLLATNGSGAVSATFTLTVQPAFAAPQWTDNVLGGTMQLRQSYRDAVTASGYPTPTYAGTGLPAGISVSRSTGQVTGTPTARPGTYSFSITASNGSGSITANYTFTVLAAFAGPGWTDSTISTTMRSGDPYSDAIAATGAPSVTYSSTGTLPPGLTLNPTTGALIGTPTSTGTYSFALRASNGQTTISVPYSVTVAPAYVAPVFTDSTISTSMRVGVPYSDAIAATGAPSVAYSSTGTLPPGLALSPTSGVLEGTPSTAGTYSFSLVAANGRDTVSVPYSLTVNPAYVPPAFTDDEIADPQSTVGYSDAVTAEGDDTISYAITAGALPAGLDLDPVTGVITGSTNATGTYSVTITAASIHGDDDAVISGTIVAAPSMALLPEFAPGDASAGAELAVIAERVAETGRWSATLYSSPIAIGSGAASMGSVTSRVTLPAGIEAGAHRVELSVTVADGSQRVSTVWFIVMRNGTIGAVSLLGPLVYSEPAAVVTNAVAAGNAALAATGTDPVLPLLVALLMLLGGVLVVRRRRSEQA